QCDADAEGDHDLKAHLVARQKPMMRAADDLEVIVDEPDRPKKRRRQPRNPDVRIREVRPQQRRRQRPGPDVVAPASARGDWGPSCRITCPIWKSRSLVIIHGPSTRLMARAVRLAAAVRN